MKFLFLIFNRLRQYYIKSKVIFLLFVIGGIFNAIMLCYFYGNLLPTVSNRESQDISYRKYTVKFENTSYGDFSALESTMNNPLIGAISATGALPNGSSSVTVRTFSGDYPISLLSGKSIFTGGNQAIVPYTCVSSLGSSISLGGISFEIIGKSTDPDLYVVSYGSFVTLGISDRITGIEIIASERQNIENDPVLQMIRDTFPNSTSIRSELDVSTTLYDRENTEHYSIQILVSYLVIALSYMFLLQYLINGMIHENIISVFIGASKADITALVFWETAALSLSIGGIGLLLHKLLYVPLFSKINVAKDLIYYFSDYLLLYLFIFATSLAVSLPLAVRYLRLSPVTARREHA